MGTFRQKSPGEGYDEVGLGQDILRQYYARCCYMDETSGMFSPIFPSFPPLQEHSCSINITLFLHASFAKDFSLNRNIKDMFLGYKQEQPKQFLHKNGKIENEMKLIEDCGHNPACFMAHCFEREKVKFTLI